MATIRNGTIHKITRNLTKQLSWSSTLLLIYLETCGRFLYKAAAVPQMRTNSRNQDRRPALWTCAKCVRPFANRNQSHSCGRYTVKEFLKGKSHESIELYNYFVEAVQECGTIIIAPAKTRVGFQVRMIFAAVDKLGERGLEAHVVLARRLEHPRFSRIESISPKNHVHHFHISEVHEIDADVREWLKEAYSVGKQDHLK